MRRMRRRSRARPRPRRGRVATTALLGVTLIACNASPAQPEQTPAPTTPAATETEAPTKTRTEQRKTTTTYKVSSGDTLSAIARRFDTTVEAIVKANKLDDPDRIVVGQELKIPAAGSGSD